MEISDKEKVSILSKKVLQMVKRGSQICCVEPDGNLTVYEGGAFNKANERARNMAFSLQEVALNKIESGEI